tara:strand:- start:1374 stop:2054 length:681 start_codon:yes stop_codon:yes gene_type:complete
LHLLIAAAGSGKRMGADKNKLLIPVAGRPILSWTLDAAIAANSISWIGVVGQPIDQDPIMDLLKGCSKPFTWIKGGSTRQESVRRGLNALPNDAEYVLIHDGARCLIDSCVFNQCAEMVSRGKAVIAATPVTDTIKKVDSNGIILETPSRSCLWAAQTPQGFLVKDLKEAHSKAMNNNWIVTDDASLYERLGWSVCVLESGPSNIKVTNKFDLVIAEAILSVRGRL